VKARGIRHNAEKKDFVKLHRHDLFEVEIIILTHFVIVQ
jgi:hypothetical protein